MTWVQGQVLPIVAFPVLPLLLQVQSMPALFLADKSTCCSMHAPVLFNQAGHQPWA